MKHVPKLLNEIGLRQNVLIRGHGTKVDQIKPSIGRNYEGPWSSVLAKEKEALDLFQKWSLPYLSRKPEKTLEWLCLMQHYGCPTRLLDFTTNPLVGLFFASDPSKSEDGEVIVVNSPTVKAANEIDGDLVFAATSPFLYHPPHYCGRIIGQSGCFIVCPNPNEGLKISSIRKVVIPITHKKEIRAELSTLGISYALLFPGLQGICDDLKDSLLHAMDFQIMCDEMVAEFPHLL